MVVYVKYVLMDGKECPVINVFTTVGEQACKIEVWDGQQRVMVPSTLDIYFNLPEREFDTDIVGKEAISYDRKGK